MDASNPIISSDRTTLQEQMVKNQKRRRQDLEYCSELVRTAERTILEVGTVIPDIEVKDVFNRYRQVTVPTTKDRPISNAVFVKKEDAFPVCGILDAHRQPLHPPNKNNSGGRVLVNRVMGGSPGKPWGLHQIIQVFGEQVLHVKKVYTAGTWEGFMKRLEEQMNRPTVSMRIALHPDGNKKLNQSFMVKLLDKLIPRKPNLQWPGVHTDIATGLMEGIKVTMNSSAGAPYWRDKADCLDQIIQVTVPMIVKALKEDTLEQLYSQNPELFLVEIKNKMDRYEIRKLNEKTRPYACVPAHWSFLFSMVTQGFQQTLDVFTENPASCNAYGFSSAGGGLKVFVEWILGADERGRVVCYGDDASLAIKRGKTIYRVDPDFKQMDGSIDEDDVKTVITWVNSHLDRDAGEHNQFWKNVCDMWLKFATNPFMIIDGTEIYKKKRVGGLMTGIPGTTLIDTVKSIVVWNAYLDHCRDLKLDPLLEKHAMLFTKKHGLVLKTGTWLPQAMPRPADGVLMTDHKFLGLQILCKHWRGELVYLPTLPVDEALEMLVVQKDNPFKEEKSKTAQSRTLFDRMRGLMITFGFTIPEIRRAIHNVVNHISGTSIVMLTQNNPRPEHVTLETFEYPDTSGFPSVDFCISVYAGGEPGEWISLFPSIAQTLETHKTQTLSLLKLSLKGDVVHVDTDEETGEHFDPVLENALALSKVNFKPTKVNKRSKVVQFNDSQHQQEVKYTPTLAQAMYSFVEARGVVFSSELLRTYEISRLDLVRECKKVGLFLTGVGDDDLVSTRVFATPFKTIQDEVVDSVSKLTLGDRNASQRVLALERSYDPVASAPHEVQLRESMLKDLSIRLIADVPAIASVHEALQKKYKQFRWVNLPVSEKGPYAHGVQLQVTPNYIDVAVAKALTAKLSKDYIVQAILTLNGIETPELDKPHIVRFPTGSWAGQCMNTAIPPVVPLQTTPQKTRRNQKLSLKRRARRQAVTEGEVPEPVPSTSQVSITTKLYD